MFKRSKREKNADGLTVTLLPGPTPTAVIMRVDNPTTTTKTFCDYHTLFEGLRNDIFEVRAEGGEELPYRGMMAKRAPPGDDDFIDVQAGASRQSDPLDLTSGYALTSGRWQVRFSGNGISGLPASAPLTLTVPGDERRFPGATTSTGPRGRRSVAAEGLVVELRQGSAPTRVVLRVENPTSTTKTFCACHSPFEGLRADLFEVRGADGVALSYVVAMVDRPPPRDDDLLDVEAGGAIESRDLDLLEGYRLTAGVWRVRFAGNDTSGLPASTTVTLTVP